MPDTMQPFAHRPLKSLLRAVAQQLDDDAYLSMSRSEFVGAVMRASGGTVNPRSAAEYYDALMKDAGVKQG